MNIKIKTNVQKLYDSYEIYLNKIIGQGSYSTVYLGKIIDNKILQKYNLNSEMVAIKKIKMENVDQRTFKMITDEVNIMQKIQSFKKECKNIIKCYDIIEEFDYIYIVMEYCENDDLSKLIGKPIKESIVKYYFAQIVNALFYLYENNIIHRDLKPKNILLKNNKKDLVLCDFGFARIKSSSMQRVTTICGSPLYMAPELLEEKSYTEIVDIWAIGMILYEMIYGEHPYNNCKDMDDLKEFSKKDIIIPPTNNRNPNVSHECNDILKKMLNKEKKKRMSLEELFKHTWIKEIMKDKLEFYGTPAIQEESEKDSDSDIGYSDSESSIDIFNHHINFRKNSL